MPLGLLNSIIIPLLGGFLFISLYKRTSPFVSRSERSRLFFWSALTGLLLYLVTRAMILKLLEFEWVNPIAVYWKALAPFDHSGTSFGSLLIAVAIALTLNVLDRKKKLDIFREHVERYGDGMESFLLEASEKAQETSPSLVMLTMEDRKVYVGWVSRTPRDITDSDAFLKLIPLMSGYRQSESLRVDFVEFYDEAITGLAEEHAEEIDFEYFAKIVPISRILSAGYFNLDAYEKFQAETEKPENAS